VIAFKHFGPSHSYGDDNRVNGLRCNELFNRGACTSELMCLMLECVI